MGIFASVGNEERSVGLHGPFSVDKCSNRYHIPSRVQLSSFLKNGKALNMLQVISLRKKNHEASSRMLAPFLIGKPNSKKLMEYFPIPSKEIHRIDRNLGEVEGLLNLPLWLSSRRMASQAFA
jgi:hypothetical protein